MFAYCGNNPINRKDSASTIWAAALTVGLGTIANVLVKAVGAKLSGESFTWKDAASAAVEGAVATTLTVLGASPVFANTMGSALGSMTNVILKGDYTEEGISGIFKDVGTTFLSTMAMGGIGKIAQNTVCGKYVQLGTFGNMLKKLFYQPKYVNSESVKTIISDTFWDSVKSIPLELIA